MSGTDRYREEFEARRGDFPGAGTPWLDTLRGSAMERFSEKGFPTSKNESWKYTNLSALVRQDFRPSEGEANGAKPLVDEPAARAVFSNGKLVSHSTAKGVSGLTVLPLGEAIREKEELLRKVLGQTEGFEHDPVGALNLAMMADGLLVHVAPGTEISAPVEICFASSTPNGVNHLRVWVVVEDRANLTLVERLTGTQESTWNNLVSEVFVGQGATLSHLKLQEESGYHLAQNRIVLEKDVSYHSTVLSLGASISRNEVFVRFDGEHSEATLNGVFLADEGQQTQHRTVMDHASAHCRSDQLFKGIAAVGGKGLYDGRVIVREGAQKTDSTQKSQNLLLGDGAEVDAKPQLEIYADDVKCAHGATSGQLDENALFYLRARGISETDARRILTEGFIHEVVDAFPVAALHDSLKTLLADRMHQYGV